MWVSCLRYKSFDRDSDGEETIPKVKERSVPHEIYNEDDGERGETMREPTGANAAPQSSSKVSESNGGGKTCLIAREQATYIHSESSV